MAANHFIPESKQHFSTDRKAIYYDGHWRQIYINAKKQRYVMYKGKRFYLDLRHIYYR